MAGLMPLLFLVRMVIIHRQDGADFRHQMQWSKQRIKSVESIDQETRVALPDFRVLSRYQDFRSDIVELSHCFLDDILDFSSPSHRNFTLWAAPLLNASLEDIAKHQSDMEPPLSSHVMEDMRDEFVLQLLEIYSSMDASQRRCDYSRYRPTIPEPIAEAAYERAQEIMNEWVDTPHIRVVFTIVAHTDVVHLEKLVSAIYMPHHLILIHIERRASIEFNQAVNRLTVMFRNLIVLRFGTIVYRTDLVSHIHWKLLNWFHNLPGLDYDYHVALDGSAYPMHSPLDLLDRIRDHSVLLGELTHRGHRVRTLQEHVWKHKRLVYTRGRDETFKRHKRLPRSLFAGTTLPSWAADALQFKSVSGNQAVLHRSVVEDLLESVHVRELFAIAKYGCCCCFEERTWIAALHLVGFGSQALRNPSMFQLWGGEAVCGSSMHNVVLTRNSSLCFRVEDATTLQTNQSERQTIYIYGNETMEYLRDARDRGFLFARKFQSDNDESLQLLQDVRINLWHL